MAADKLQVLRKGREELDILIRVQDLKVYPKEKREQLLTDYKEEDDVPLEPPRIMPSESIE